MAGVIGSIGSFDDSTEEWSSYSEWFGYLVAANGIQNDKLVPPFAKIVVTLTKHFSPKPLVIAERFRFHKRNQEEGEYVTVFVESLRKLAL